MPVECSVIIPTYQRAAALAETLDALARQTASGFEVVVVSDGPDPKTSFLAETYKAPYPLRWIFNPRNQGQAWARNTGAEAARSDILLFLDDDTVPAPDCVEQHLRCRRSFPAGAGVVVLGRIRHQYCQPARSHTERLLREARDRALEQYEIAASGRRLEFGRMAACGLNASLPRSVFLAAGGYDRTLHYVDEDTDLGARLYSRGFRFIPAPEAVVIHHDTKDIVDYACRITRLSGPKDLYRRRKKQQWNGRIPLLAQMHSGSWGRRLAHRMAWRLPRLFQLAASVSRAATDATGSRLAFSLWSKSSVGDYWQGVRAEGETIHSLRDVAGPPVPVLVFHSITAPAGKNLWAYYLSPAKFDRFIRAIKLAGYRSVFAEEWLAAKARPRSVVLTFDDAYDDFYTEAFPVLQRHGLDATVFVVVDRIGQTNLWDQSGGGPRRSLLALSQIRELQRQGVQFGSHTLTHPMLTRLSDRELDRELGDSRRKLEDLLGVEVRSIAYPWGGVDGRVRAAAARAGYQVGMTTEDGMNRFEDPLALKRTNVCEIDNLGWLALKLATGRDLRQHGVERLIQWGLHPGWGEEPKAPSSPAEGHPPPAGDAAARDILPRTPSIEP